MVPARLAAARPAADRVLVSLSTFSFRGMQECLQRVVDATDGLGVDVVVTAGPAVDPAALRVHPRAEVHRYVPHAELMPAATVFVGHGGHGTTMQALAHDLPMVLLPQDSRTDQPLVARSIERAGAGRTLGRRAAPERIRAAVQEMLADGPHREAARRLGAQVREMPGARRGADEIERRLPDRASAAG